jgi:aminoglycoside phosphotransferase (APT) family kinase protein
MSAAEGIITNMTGTTQQAGAGEFDAGSLRRLGAWLERHDMPGKGQPRLHKFPGGQSNPTYRLEWGERVFVLRRKPFGVLLPKAHMVEREHRVLSALEHTAVPVPKVRGLCEDTTVLGVAFYVMDHVEGRIFWDPRLPELDRTERAAMFSAINATVASLHAVEPAEVGLQSFGRPAGFMDRQVRLWSAQYQAAVTRDIPAMGCLARWLSDNLPAEEPVGTIFHGDLRIDNLIFHPIEPRVVAILDWELATLGDPVADFAYHLVSWRIPPELFRGLAGVDHVALGIPTEAQYVIDYCRRRGWSELPHMTFYLAFSFFRLASILQGIARRAQDGNASAPDAVALGAKAAPLAELGWDLVRSADRRG